MWFQGVCINDILMIINNNYESFININIIL